MAIFPDTPHNKIESENNKCELQIELESSIEYLKDKKTSEVGNS